jgi:hypothetical protein
MADGPIAAVVAIASTPKIAQKVKSARSQNPNTLFLSILRSVYHFSSLKI